MLVSTIRNSRILKKINTIIIDVIPVIKHFFVYLTGALVLRSISLVTAPITMSIVSPSDYGSLALLNSFISMSCIIAGLGLRQALSLEYFHYTQEEQITLIKNIVIIYSIITLPVLICCALNYRIINYYCLMNTAIKSPLLPLQNQTSSVAWSVILKICIGALSKYWSYLK